MGEGERRESFANAYDTELEGSLLPADAQPHLCT